jgi:hypothetical protein
VLRYLLVTLPTDEAAAALTDLLGEVGAEVFEHGPGCCCKNCPWDGNHG